MWVCFILGWVCWGLGWVIGVRGGFVVFRDGLLRFGIGCWGLGSELWSKAGSIPWTEEDKGTWGKACKANSSSKNRSEGSGRYLDQFLQNKLVQEQDSDPSQHQHPPRRVTLLCRAARRTQHSQRGHNSPPHPRAGPVTSSFHVCLTYSRTMLSLMLSKTPGWGSTPLGRLQGLRRGQQSPSASLE